MMLHKFIITFIILISYQTSLNAQDIKKDTIPGSKGKLDVAPETKLEKKKEKKIYSISQFGSESLLFFKQPLRWKGNNWLHVEIGRAHV